MTDLVIKIPLYKKGDIEGFIRCGVFLVQTIWERTGSFCALSHSLADVKAKRMPAETIDDVIRSLDSIVEWAHQQQNRAGYFAALYRRVTKAVKQGIATGRFQNGARMERLDVIFANRYLTAFDDWRQGKPTTLSWKAAFDCTAHWYPLVLQHLLVGMNAHINLDLGVAAAACSPGDQLQGLQADFNQINNVLAEQVATVEQEMASISPWVKLLNTFGLRTETTIINFSMSRARDCAWNEACNLATASPDSLPAAIAAVDLRIGTFGELVASPPFLVKLKLLPIRLKELNGARNVLDVLAADKAAVAARA